MTNPSAGAQFSRWEKFRQRSTLVFEGQQFAGKWFLRKRLAQEGLKVPTISRSFLIPRSVNHFLMPSITLMVMLGSMKL